MLCVNTQTQKVVKKERHLQSAICTQLFVFHANLKKDNDYLQSFLSYTSAKENIAMDDPEEKLDIFNNLVTECID